MYCKDTNRRGDSEHTSFDFLGYTFRGRLARGPRGYFTSFSPAMSAKAKKAILTLAVGSFNIVGGQTKTVTLHLSVKARTLLARMHVLKALATVVSADAAKVTRTTKSTLTLRRGKH